MTREWTDKVGHKTALSHQRRPAAAEEGKKKRTFASIGGRNVRESMKLMENKEKYLQMSEKNRIFVAAKIA